MKRASLWLGTGLGLVCLVGCATTELSGLLRIASASAAQGQVMPVPMEVAVDVVTDSLRKQGLKAVVTPRGEEVVINTSTPTGTRFRFVLHRERTEAGERTRSRLEWIDERDEKLEVDLLTDVAQSGGSS